MGAPLDLADPEGVVFEPGRPYLVRLMESVRLPEDAVGRTNPRSSTGRLDVFTRVISDHGTQFDEIEPGYEGPLWLEVLLQHLHRERAPGPRPHAAAHLLGGLVAGRRRDPGAARARRPRLRARKPQHQHASRAHRGGRRSASGGCCSASICPAASSAAGGRSATARCSTSRRRPPTTRSTTGSRSSRSLAGGW